jgi:hypothetical protein
MTMFELAAAGRTGALGFGASIADIIQAFGEPDDRLASDPSALLKYGDLELIFTEGVLTVVHCEFGSPPLPAAPDGSRLGVNTTDFAWPIDLDALDAVAGRAGLNPTRSEEEDGSVTAAYGPATLLIDHNEQIAALSIERRHYFEPLSDGWTTESIDRMLASGDDTRLHEVPIAISLNPPDCEWAVAICTELADHSDPTVRGNAVLGFGHLARTCPDVPLSDIVAARLGAALDDAESYVAGQAMSAHEDIVRFRGIVLCESPGGAVWFAPLSGDATRSLTAFEIEFLRHFGHPSPWADIVDVRLHADAGGRPWLLVHMDFIERGAVRDTLRLDVEEGRIRGGWSPSFLNGDDGVKATEAGIDVGSSDGIDMTSSSIEELARVARAWFDDHALGWHSSARRDRWGDG